MTVHLTMDQRQLARRLHAKGLSLREVGRQVGCSHEVVRTVVRRDSKRPVRSGSWQPGPGRLSLADREEISLGLRAGDTFTVIALRLGRAVSTVSREVAGNGGRQDYRAWRAHQRARERARRPKTPKLSRPRLATQVTTWLKEWWSPQEISGRLRIEFAEVQAGVPVSEVAERFGVSRQAVHRWIGWYRKEGLEGLVDRSHRPHG